MRSAKQTLRLRVEPCQGLPSATILGFFDSDISEQSQPTFRRLAAGSSSAMGPRTQRGRQLRLRGKAGARSKNNQVRGRTMSGSKLSRVADLGQQATSKYCLRRPIQEDGQHAFFSRLSGF